ncbi:hypothetical protein C1H46_003094 [Malus baccata]|uniref:Uncharacterized protein n=1 Tax=Malus baccata TaxID=106549 RepID=A0A540NLI5_MALBA|nr:hypothetical protein C1H46_003094 [Malus baccata]
MKSRASSVDNRKSTSQGKKVTSDDIVKHFRPRVVKDSLPSNKLDFSHTLKKLKSEGFTVKPKTAKALTKEVALAGSARRTKSARASASFGTPKPHEFLDITKASEEKWSVGEADGNKAVEGGLATEESSNTSVESDLGSREHPQAFLGKDTKGEENGREPSDKDDSKATEDVDFDELDGFLNDDVQAEMEGTEGARVGVEALRKLKHNIANETRVLNSIEELIPSSEAFFSRVDFMGVKVHSRLAEALGKFFERVDDANVSLIGLSSFMRGMIFEELGTLLYGMEHTSTLEITEHRLLC